MPSALVSLSLVIAPSSCALSRTSANASTFGSAPAAGTSSTPNATSVPSHERSCARVGPPFVASLADALNCATSFGQLGKRAPSAISCFHAVELSSMFASTNTTVEAGKACAARPSVPAAPAGADLGGAAAAGEHETHQGEGGAREQQAPEDGDTSSRHDRTL